MSFILALDQGTTSSRAIVFDHGGSIRAVAQREFAQIYPQPGWVEHDPMEIWATQSGVLTEVLAKAGLGAADIAAIGITNQRETTLRWERATGKPVANAIVWQDRRTAPDCDALREAGHAPLIARKTGLVIDAYFSGTKLRWLLDHVPGARARAARGELAFGTVDSWLVWNLSGGAAHVTDASNASRTMLFDIHSGDWDDELLALLDVPRSVLPQVVASSGRCAEAALQGAGVPIAGIAGDQQAALFGQACLQPGLAKNTYGTGCFLLLNTGRKAVASKNNLVSTVAWRLGAGSRSPRCERRRQRRRVSRTRFCRPWRTALGRVCARVDLRPHARHDGGAHRPRRPRVHRLSERRAGAGDGIRCRYPAFGASRRRRRHREQSPHAIPGRYSRRAGDSSESRGDDGARRGLSRRTGRGILARSRRHRRQLAGGAAVRAGDVARQGGFAHGGLEQGGRAREAMGLNGIAEAVAFIERPIARSSKTTPGSLSLGRSHTGAITSIASVITVSTPQSKSRATTSGALGVYVTTRYPA